MEKFIEKSTERLSPGKSITANSKNDSETSPTKTKKKIKVVKKQSPDDQSPVKETNSKEINEISPIKERKSPEKKLESGFLYSIGQKFEKMRENSKKEKEKKISKSDPVEVTLKVASAEKKSNDVETVQTFVIPRRVKDGTSETMQKEEITIRQIDPRQIDPTINSVVKEQRKSRIDAVIRNLRERSVPHTLQAEGRESELTTESGLLKRAVSVEDMTNGARNFHKGNVNKVLGLFRRIEKDHHCQKKQPPASNGNIEPDSKERPKSGGFVSKMKKSNRPYYTGAKSDTIITLTDRLDRQILNDKTNQPISGPAKTVEVPVPFLRSSSISNSDGPSNIEVTNGAVESNIIANEKVREAKPATETSTQMLNSEKERIRNNRKGLVLNLSNEQFNDQFKNISNDYSNNNNSYLNSNGKSLGGCNGSIDNHVNNNYYHYYGHSERSSVAFTPTGDVATNYSSDNRSTRDDESTSTFLSPTDEPELCFDDWSACSGSTDDHNLHPKHLKYASLRHSEQNHNHLSTIDPMPSTPSDSESVIDRIKRRSYYCRFNEKKPKRTSTIVGTAAQREYYRDMANKSKSRTSEYLPIFSNGSPEGEVSSRGGSKSPTPMNASSQFKENASRANTPSYYSPADESDKVKCQPDYHYNYHQRSQTPSRNSVKSPFEKSASKAKSSDYVNLRSTLTSPTSTHTVSKYLSNPASGPSSLTTSDYQPTGSRSYSLRNSAYDSLTPSIYGTYNPKRRLSTSYLAPAIAAANSTNSYSGLKDHLSSSCYATLGRSRPRAYDHRSISMLDTSISPSTILSKRMGTSNSSADHPYTNSHYRPVHDYGHFNTRSSLRSPTIQTSSSNV